MVFQDEIFYGSAELACVCDEDRVICELCCFRCTFCFLLFCELMIVYFTLILRLECQVSDVDLRMCH